MLAHQMLKRIILNDRYSQTNQEIRFNKYFQFMPNKRNIYNSFIIKDQNYYLKTQFDINEKKAMSLFLNIEFFSLDPDGLIDEDDIYIDAYYVKLYIPNQNKSHNLVLNITTNENKQKEVTIYIEKIE